jgi:hypothetical protein
MGASVFFTATIIRTFKVSEVTWQWWDALVPPTIVAVKNIDAPMLTRVWQELEYCIDVCRVTGGAHIEHL